MLSLGVLGDVAPAFAAPTLVGVETQTRLKVRVLSGSNHQLFNRLIKDDEPYLGFEFQTNNVSIG